MYNYRRFMSTLVATSIIAAVTASSAALDSKILSVNDIRPQTIYVQENDTYVPFIKISDNYDGNTLLLRQDVLETSMPIDANNSYYEKSMIDDYLNNGYIDALKIKDEIIKSSIVITNESSIGKSGSQSKTIDRRIFLLSAQELGLISTSAYEGECIRYFRNPSNRFAYMKDKPMAWWLRTPNTEFETTSYSIGSNTRIRYEDINKENGIRPALCIPDQNIIKKSNDIIQGQAVFYI